MRELSGDFRVKQPGLTAHLYHSRRRLLAGHPLQRILPCEEFLAVQRFLPEDPFVVDDVQVRGW